MSRLEVYGVANYAPAAVMTVSIEDFVLEAPMTYNADEDRYEYVINTATDLDGRRITISTDLGGADRVNIE